MDPFVPAPSMAITLITNECQRAISATPILISMKPRASFDGDGFDIAYDLKVWWKKGDESFGYHTGTVRADAKQCASAQIFWGHYDFDTHDDCLDDCQPEPGWLLHRP
jgi:hypothetical protein